MIVKNLYHKYKSDIKYNTSLILSEIVAPFGAAAAAYLFYESNLNKYISSGVGGIIGNYISAILTFWAAWYLLNKEVYLKNNTRFFKEIVEIAAKNLVPAGISYLVYIPISAGFIYYNFTPPKSAFYASILSAVIFIVGSNIINQRIIKLHRYK